MKLPNDLIKATDYSKAKDREIHEFEYRNGKYIHKYVLGGEHELTPQEIIDCLNAISTIDCDLQTAYAYIQGQKDKIAELETKLAEKEKEITQRLVIQERDYSQDKISFAVEQLEKVKETTECVLDNALKNSSLNQSYYDRLLDEIDNQIKQLKEMK